MLHDLLLTHIRESAQRHNAASSINDASFPSTAHQSLHHPPALKYLFAASVMMITTSMISTFWKENPLPFCSGFWVLIGDEDKCFWRPSKITLSLACTMYTIAATWLYRQSWNWGHRNATISAAVSLGLGISLLLGLSSERILRNTLPWSVFFGLFACAVLSYGRARSLPPCYHGI